MTTHLATTYAHLPGDVSRVLRHLSLLQLHDFDAGLTAAACGLSQAEARTALDTLTGRRLLDQVGHDEVRGDVYGFTSADVRALARHHAASLVTDSEADEILSRALGWDLNAAEKADALVTKNHARSGREHPHISEHPVPLTQPSQALSWLESQAENLRSMRKALDDRVEAGYERGAALTKLLLGVAARMQGDLENAGELFHSAQETLLGVGDRHDAARAQAHEGYRLILAGNVPAAEEQLHQAQAEFAGAGVDSAQWVAKTDEWLGLAAQADYRLKDAFTYFTASLERYTALRAPDANRLREHLADLTRTTQALPSSDATAPGTPQ